MARKADCTPEQWEKYKETARQYYLKNREKRIAQTAVYNQTEKAKARRKAYDMLPEQVAKRKVREAQYGKDYRKAYYEKLKSDPIIMEQRRERHREWRTGFSPELYSALLVAQDAKCAICYRDFTQQKGSRRAKGATHPCADHCHDGGGARGLLCHNCNTIEGHIRSSGLTPESYLQRLHDYLLEPPVKKLR
jgi:hypothetical protein